MFEIDKHPEIIYFLKTISIVFIDKSQHIIIHCPYCDDANRSSSNVTKHGHLYISKNLPVFYCHRCSTAGSIISLLLTYNFDNKSALNELTNYVKFNFKKSYKIKTKKINTNNFIKDKILNYDNIELFFNYLKNRLGMVNIGEYLIYPDYIYNFPTVSFLNNTGEFSVARFINNPDKRYYKGNSIYYFQNWSEINNYESVIITEGPFDLLSLKIYNNNFKDSFFISVNGKNYLNIIEELRYGELFDKNIHLVFDSDNIKSNWKYRLPNIIRWKPIENIKDAGDFPIITEI